MTATSVPPDHADFHRVLTQAARMFNTVDIAVVAAHSNERAEILSLRVTGGYAKQRVPDLVVQDRTWFAIRAQRDSSIFGRLLSEAYQGKDFFFDGIPHRCSFQVAVAAGNWSSNGTHQRGDGVWVLMAA